MKTFWALWPIIKAFARALWSLHKKDAELTWTCESCHRTRPDKKISVYSFPIKDLPGAVRNWRYCNDRLQCRTIAYTEAPKGPFTTIKRIQAELQQP